MLVTNLHNLLQMAKEIFCSCLEWQIFFAVARKNVCPWLNAENVCRWQKKLGYKLGTIYRSWLKKYSALA